MKPARVYTEFRSGFAQIIIVAVIALVIGAVAVFGYQKYIQKPTLAPTQSPSNSDKITNQNSPSPDTSDETANWKTYNAKVAKVSFKLPLGWSVIEREGAVYNGEKANRDVILKGENDFGITYTENFFGGFAGTKVIDNLTKEVEIDGIKVRKEYLKDFPAVEGQAIDLSGSPDEMHIEMHRGNSANFFIASFKKETFAEEDKILDQILSTFKFTQ